ncbi:MULTISPECIES: hypothetical protein [Rhodococcus]|uniref:Uncharacterized protein n=1 Tax=Rhodococcus koreensis TaxID=99653 RepID=A0A1H4X3A4_9NOCA|nr:MULTISPECIES: hypothetical protein [Rhodococcus]QSE80480.1 hypothetical protein JWS14_15600 [Rhodococcus koreensis]SEC99388.1 hypothetical protein SAMN04490239_6312 [Rhodococcus koreensis]
MMFIELSLGFVALREFDDLSRLHVQAPPEMTLESIDSSLRAANLGRIDDLGTAITISELRARINEVWAPRSPAFDKMIAYATDKGWVSSDGRDLRAHIIRKESKM